MRTSLKVVSCLAAGCVLGTLSSAAQEVQKRRTDDNTYLPVVITKPFDQIYK
jgi:hypothetical protein